jgi:hypothetical protein
MWGFLDGEIITVLEIICLVVILAGVYLANRPDKKESRERSLLTETEFEDK